MDYARPDQANHLNATRELLQVIATVQALAARPRPSQPEPSNQEQAPTESANRSQAVAGLSPEDSGERETVQRRAEPSAEEIAMYQSAIEQEVAHFRAEMEELRQSVEGMDANVSWTTGHQEDGHILAFSFLTGFVCLSY